MSNILIFGGTGAMGEHLVNILSESKNNQIYVTTRKKRNSKKENVFYEEGDAKNNIFLSEILAQKQWDCIVDFMVYNTDEFKNRVNQLLNSTKQYIFISSARVYANSETPITESSPRLLDVCTDKEYLATDEYALTKARQENILFEHINKNWTIVRPYITYSEQRLQLGVLEKEDWLYRALHGRTVVFSKDIDQNITTMTNGYDVANGIRDLIGYRNAFGQAYHIMCNNRIKWSDVWAIYSQALKLLTNNHVKCMLVDNETFMNTRPTNMKWQVLFDRLYNRYFNTTKIETVIDITTFITPEIGLAKCLSIFLSNPIFKNVNWKSEAIKDRITNERTSWNEIKGFKNKLQYYYYRYIK